MKKKRNSSTTAVLVVLLFAGLSLLLYPSISDYWNSYHSSQAISDYSEAVKGIDTEKYGELLNAAEEYNRSLVKYSGAFKLNNEQLKQYEGLLDISGNGVMGYIEIPKIGVNLPVYHGTDESVLQIAVGHLDWSSLPVGGRDTHCVLSGHRGLPSARLFTNLDKMAVGDVFVLRVLNEVLTYEVDKVSIVEPLETDDLKVESGKDLCTLVTCTPYGINTHRILVRGHRVENTEEALSIRITAEANQIEPLVVAPIVALPILLIALIILFLPGRRKKYRGESDEIF